MAKTESSSWYKAAGWHIKHPENDFTSTHPIFRYMERKGIVPKKALDLGGGSGYMAETIVRKTGADVVYVEQDARFEKAVFKARARLRKDGLIKEGEEKISFFGEGIENFDFSGEKFDLIFATYVFCYLEEEKVRDIIKNAVSSLNDGGLFSFNFVGSKDFRATSEHEGFSVSSPEYIKTILSACGIPESWCSFSEWEGEEQNFYKQEYFVLVEKPRRTDSD